MEQRPSIPFIHIARFLAPLFVLWAHLGPWWCIENVSTCVKADALWTPIQITVSVAGWLHLNVNGGHLGVLLFFLVSGFIISHIVRSENRREFAIKRVFRIAPMLIAGLIMAYALSSALVAWGLPPILGFTAHSLKDLLLAILLLDTVIPSPITNGVTWSLVPEVGFYVTLVAIWPALLRWPLASTYLMIALVAVITLGTMVGVPLKPAHYYFMQVEFILVGRAIYLGWSGQASWGAALLLGMTALATLAALHFATDYGQSVLIAENSVAYSWGYALAIFIALMASRRCPRIIRFVSDTSYSIYLLHIPIGSLVMNVLSLRYGVSLPWSFPIAFAVVLATSYATYRLVEVPGQRFGRHIAARWRSTGSVAMMTVASAKSAT